MTILIKGIDMPESGMRPLWVVVHSDGMVEYESNDEGWKHTKAISVSTPHGDLIDRKKLLDNAGGVYTARPEEAQKIQHEINKVLFAIQDAPTVIEAEGE